RVAATRNCSRLSHPLYFGDAVSGDAVFGRIASGGRRVRPYRVSSVVAGPGRAGNTGRFTFQEASGGSGANDRQGRAPVRHPIVTPHAAAGKIVPHAGRVGTGDRFADRPLPGRPAGGARPDGGNHKPGIPETLPGI